MEKIHRFFDSKKFKTTVENVLNRLKVVQLKWICKKGLFRVLAKIAINSLNLQRTQLIK